MHLPKIAVQDLRLAQLLNDMGAGKLQVPRFQRDFVWPVTKTRALLDSMYKEFPIGSFFLWRAPAGSPPLYRPLQEELGIPLPKPGSEIIYILDGQQRLTSLYVVINGIKVGRREYGRICIDLETATRYDQNQEEGFEDDIFVYRQPDNRRHIALCDLLGPNDLTIYDQIPAEWKPAFNKAHNLFVTYPFSVVWIQEQQLSDAILIFQRINQAGQRLSRYDLVCANVWREDFDFRKRIAHLNHSLYQHGFGAIDETIYTQTFALVLHDKCTTLAELSLETDEIRAVWDQAVNAIRLAIDFAANNLGIKRADYLPYRGILVVLAYYFYHAPSSAISARERAVLWSWFWQVALSERYSSTSPSRMAEDALRLRGLHQGLEVSFDYPSKVTIESVARTKMTSTSSVLRNAFLCLMALKQPRNLKDGSVVNLADPFFSNLKRAERHHVFPVGYLRKQGVAAEHVHLLPNFCFIPADLNKEIGSRAPAEYLAQYQKANPQFAAAADSHLLPIAPNAAIWSNDFSKFLEQRAQAIADELNRLVGSKPEDLGVVAVVPGIPWAGKVDLIEIRLRDLIDHRLTAVVGPQYWKTAIPGDVNDYAKQKIAARLQEHPYEDASHYASGRSRLDYCDVSHYEKIIVTNWGHFAEFFGKKEELHRHMSAFQTIRNCVQHNRPATDIERMNGEAAIRWLERIMDKYDQDTSPEAEDNGEEVMIDEMPTSTLAKAPGSEQPVTGLQE